MSKAFIHRSENSKTKNKEVIKMKDKITLLLELFKEKK